MITELVSNLKKGNLFIIGFLIIALTTLVITFKQAKAADAAGDVSSTRAKIAALELKAKDSDDKDKYKEDLEKLRDKTLPKQQLQAQEALAALPNGAVIWTFLGQIGVIALGLGLISMAQREGESQGVRAAAILAIAVVIFALLSGQTQYLGLGRFN